MPRGEPGMIVIPPTPDRKPPAKPPRPKLEIVKSKTVEKPVELLQDDLIEEPDEMELSAEEVMEVREPGELQEKDVEEAFVIRGFKGLEVAATLEKKDERKNKPENRNQDNVILDPETGLIGVLDGLGGEGAGDLASKGAEQVIPERFAQALKDAPKSQAEVQRALVDQQLRKLGASSPELAAQQRVQVTKMIEGMQMKDPAMARKALALMEAISASNEAVKETGGKTTACVGFIHEAPDGSRWAVVANVGDSAAYKRRANGEMVPLTKEDSLLNRMTDTGEMSPELLAQLKKEPDKKFPIPVTLDLIRAAGGTEKDYEKAKGNTIPMSYKKLKVTMVGALGSSNPEPSLAIRRLDKGDELIMGTDGLVDKFEDPATEDTNLAELSRASSAGTTQTERMNALRREAKTRKTYKEDDDVAIVSARVA
ncbi:MAG TPA: protein phosphatase 2C domain-containing protein [Candidatus Methylomirabilis sp.]|nr:protein phosphatase 2C domain-containing protein [Candidatus Methylomirabilis sp.]